MMGVPQAHHGGHEHGRHGSCGVQMLHGQVALLHPTGRNWVLLCWLVGRLVLVARCEVAGLWFLRGLRLAASWLLGFVGWCLAGVAPVALWVKILKSFLVFKHLILIRSTQFFFTSINIFFLS